jgi:hypothetical protein
MRPLLLAAPALLLLTACGDERMTSYSPDASAGQPRELEGSIFPDDQHQVSNEQVAQVLDGKIPLHDHGGLAVLSLGRWAWSDAGFTETARKTVADALAANRYVGDVATVPRLLMPDRVTIPVLREMAARMQCENILVYTVTDDSRYDYHPFAPDQIRVELTIEAVVLNVRTGCLPIAVALDREASFKMNPNDPSAYEFTRRAQRDVVLGGLKEVSARIDKILADVK